MQFSRRTVMFAAGDEPGGKMLRTLLESQAARTRRSGGAFVSIAVHTSLIALAVAATARATSAPRAIKPDPVHVIYPMAPTIREVSHKASPWRSSGSNVVPPVRPLLVPPVVVPRTLPSIDLTRPQTDESLFDGTHVSLATGVQGSGRVTSPTDGVYTPNLVEKAAAPRPGNPAPAYPSALRSAQIEGSVVARFVVDTTGRAEPESIGFPEATHAQFAAAVRQALLRSRYLPAVISGRPVRQLVEQRFAFTLTR
jgi:protein TonB